MKKSFKEHTKFNRGRKNTATRKEVTVGLCVMTPVLHRVLWVLPLRKPKAQRKCV